MDERTPVVAPLYGVFDENGYLWKHSRSRHHCVRWAEAQSEGRRVGRFQHTFTIDPLMRVRAEVSDRRAQERMILGGPER